MANQQSEVGTEAELAALAARRQQLSQRRVAAETKRADAKRARIEMLKVGGELEKHNQVLRDAGDEIASIDELLVEIDAQVLSTEARLVAEREAAQRNQAANRLEALRPAILHAAAELDLAAVKLGKAFDALVRIMPDGFRVVDIHGKFAGRSEYAAALLAEAMFAAAPEAFDVFYQNSGHQAALHRVFGLAARPDYRAADRQAAALSASAAAAAELLIIGRLTDLAQKIREGGEPIASSAFQPAPAKASNIAPTLPSETITIIAREDFALRLSASGPTVEVRLLETHTLPHDAAGMAITTGVAFRADDSRVEDLRWDVKQGRHRVVGGKFAIERQSDGQMISRALDGRARASVTSANQQLERSF